MKKWVCQVCGYIYEGDTAPEECPVCHVGAEKFEELKGEMVWADEHRIGVAQGVAEDVIEELRANFVGECSEVGMYLAMSRQADREGYPEVAEAYKRIAFEEAEHAAKFAELLGECVVADPRGFTGLNKKGVLHVFCAAPPFLRAPAWVRRRPWPGVPGSGRRALWDRCRTVRIS